MTDTVEDWYTLNQLADRLGYSPRTLYGWRRNGSGPKSFRINGYRICYWVSDVEAWLNDSNRAESEVAA